MPHTFLALAVRFWNVPEQTLGALVANCIPIAKSVCKQTVIENVSDSQGLEIKTSPGWQLGTSLILPHSVPCAGPVSLIPLTVPCSVLRASPSRLWGRVLRSSALTAWKVQHRLKLPCPHTPAQPLAHPALQVCSSLRAATAARHRINTTWTAPGVTCTATFSASSSHNCDSSMY